MATVASAHLHILGESTLTLSSPHGGDAIADLENQAGGRRWKDGTASGQIDRIYRVTGSLGSGATDSYDLLAAGSLVDSQNQAIDLDELKGLILKCTSGAIKLDAPAANYLGIFSDASDLINLASGETVAFDFGAAGLDVSTNSKFDVVETGASTATYELWLVGAQ